MRRCLRCATGALALALLVALLLSPASAQIETAASLEMDGRYQEARDLYRSFADDHPRHRLAPLAVIAQANIELLALGNPAAAIAGYERLLRDYPRSEWAPEAARRKAEILQDQESWKAAGDAYGAALTLAAGQPEGPGADWINEVSLAAGDCFFQAGEHGAVIETYETVLENPMPAEAAATITYRLADCYETQGRLQLAAAHYAELIRSYPGMQPARDALQKRELIEQHETLAWDTYLALAEARGAAVQRDFATARDRYQQAYDATEDPTARRVAEYGTIYTEAILSGDFTRGLARLEGFIDQVPDRSEFPNSGQVIQLFRGAAEAERRVAEHPDEPAALEALGTQCLQMGAAQQAIEALDRARTLDPKDNDILLALGYAYRGAGRAREAREAFDLYLEHDPGNTQVINTIGYACLGSGDVGAAIDYFERYVQAAPDDPNAHDSLGEGYLNAGRLEEAAQQYERAIALDANFANPRFMLGNVYRQLDRPKKAAEAYRRFLELNASGPQAEQARAALQELEGAL